MDEGSTENHTPVCDLPRPYSYEFLCPADTRRNTTTAAAAAADDDDDNNNNNAIITSKRRSDVVSTLKWLYYYVMCPLGTKIRLSLPIAHIS